MISPALRNPAMPICRLESLPADIQIHRVSTASFFDDLEALLWASSILFGTFVTTKKLYCSPSWPKTSVEVLEMASLWHKHSS
jgi:hypothetical protein